MVKGSFKVVVTDYDYPTLDIEREILGRVGAMVIGAHCKTDDQVREVAEDAHALLVQYARISRDVIAHLRCCLVIARYGVGLDIVDVEAATENGILVTNVPHYCVSEVADHAVAMFLCLVRRLREYDQAVRQGKWHWSASGAALRRLTGRVAGIVGFGKIGRAISKRLKAFDMEILVYDPGLSDEQVAALGCRKVGFGELLRAADAVFVQAPLTSETRHMFDRAALSSMKQSAILIDTARGPIVDNSALYWALSTGRLMGAALDDLEEEPAKQSAWRPTNPLLSLPNLLVSPHSAYYSEEAIEEARMTAASEVARVLTGESPRHLVNPQVLECPTVRWKAGHGTGGCSSTCVESDRL